MQHVMDVLRGLFGLLVLLTLAWAMSSNRRNPPWRVIIGGLTLQLALAVLILGTAGGRIAFEAAGGFITKLVSVTTPGAELVFGNLAQGADGQLGFIFAFAGSGLIVIIFFSALLSILYHFGIVQVIVWCLARVMSATMGLSGAESMAMAANIFVGQTEAPLVVRPYIPGMTMSELNALMTGGFATIAGSVLAVYMGLLGEDLAPHLLTASVMSAPAAFVIAKIIRPEMETPETRGKVDLRIERTAHNFIEAAADGTKMGLKLYLNVVAMLIAFTALVALIDWPIGWFGDTFLNMPVEATADVIADPLSLSTLFGWLLAPLAWCMGVDGWADCQALGGLLGTKIAVNELVAFTQMFEMIGNDGFVHERTQKMAAYALCGFANFASIGIQLGGIGPMAPKRGTDLSRLAIRAMLGGALASATTATIAGMFLR